MRTITTISYGGRRPIVCVGGSKARGWSVFLMNPTPHGHRFERELKGGFPLRKTAEAWAKQYRAGEVTT